MTESMKPAAILTWMPHEHSWHVSVSIAASKQFVADGVQRMELYTAAQLEQARREGAADLACFRSLIKFLLRSDVDEREQFLRLWNEGSFEQCRRWWPEAPEEVYPKKEKA